MEQLPRSALGEGVEQLLRVVVDGRVLCLCGRLSVPGRERTRSF